MTVHPNSKNTKNPKENPKEGKRRKKKQKFWKPVRKMSWKILQTIINTLLLLTMITHPTSNKETLTNLSQKNPRKIKRTLIQRHWKIVQKTTWNFIQMLIKSLIITGIIKHSMDDLFEEEIHKKLWLGYSHDSEIVNQKGNAFPIKQATMMRKRSNITKTYKSQRINHTKLKNW